MEPIYVAASRGNKIGKSTMNDCGAFDGFLKQVESMHTQGKASFEDEFNVSHMGCMGYLSYSLYSTMTTFIFHTHTRARTRTHTQYKSVEKRTASSTVVAELNNEMNRYKNIFPCECLTHTSVNLYLWFVLHR